MNSDAVDLAALIERVLPLERLPRRGRPRGPSHLREATTEPLEEVARLALSRLAAGATSVRQRAASTTGAAAVAQVARGPTVETPAAPETFETGARAEPTHAGIAATPLAESALAEAGIAAVPRASLPDGANVAPGQIRRLLRLGDPMLAADPRRGEARAGLALHLERAAHEVLGSVAVRLVAADAAGADPVTRAAQSHPDVIFCARSESDAAGDDAHARAWLGLVSARGDALGVLEVTGLTACDDRDLGLVALLGDYAAGVLERAARVESLVFVDPMTGAYNRSYFENQMQNEMARAERDLSGMALCIADIDDFKSFNTRFGYEGGNQVLIRVAQALKGGVRPFDTVARWGGEEFAVLLSAPVQAQDVLTVAERLRGLVERLTVPIVGLDGAVQHVRVTVSLGAALFPSHGASTETLWRAANVALLEAKKPPKNRVVFGTG